MVLPYLFGIVFLHEQITALRIIGIIIMIIALTANSLEKKEERKKEKASGKYIVMCIAVFVLNGFVSIFSKLHQINTGYETVSTGGFVLMGGLTSLFLSGILLIPFAKTYKGDGINWRRAVPLAVVVAVCGGASYFLQLVSAVHLPATVLYPMITGGTIFLTAAAGRILFGEKLEKKQLISVTLAFLATFMFL